MGVAMATVDAMISEYGCCASDILVAVGPSVGACCFTLDQQEALDFINIHPDCVPDPGSARPHVNIRLANRCVSDVGLLVSSGSTTSDDLIILCQASPPGGWDSAGTHP